MSISNKPIEAIDASDLQALVLNQVMESRSLEYKEALPGNSDEDKREFLADISSFANTSGGDLLYGIREDSGVASEVCGLEISDIDAEILRLQSIVRTGLDPKIPRVVIQSVAIQNNRVVFLVRTPRSWAQPHMVIFKNSSRFYKRHSNGKYQLDVREIRDAFLFADTITERIRDFRDERLNLIAEGRGPIALINPGSFLALHVIPIEAFSIESRFDVNSLVNNFPRPLSVGSGTGRRINFDGLLTFDVVGDRFSTYSYIQVFRNGIIEAVDTTNMVYHNNEALIDPAFQCDVLTGLKRLLAVQRELGVEPPLLVGLSLLGVKDHRMGVEQRFGRYSNEPIDRDNLLVPDVMIEAYDVRLVDVMKPAFDAVWNACGWNQSLNYDSEGGWIGGRF